PLQGDRRLPRRRGLLLLFGIVDPLLGLAEFQLERIEPGPHQTDRAAILGVGSRLDPGINPRPLCVGAGVALFPKRRGMLCFDDEFIQAALRSEDGAFPADRKLVRLHFLRRRAPFAKVELYHGVDAVDDPVPSSRPSALVVLRVQASRILPTALLPKAADE